MVFESIVVDVLNRVLGDYVQNLDSKQLSIGIWGGDVVLQDLLLKQTALDDLNLPIQIVYGRLGKLVLKIPWKNLYGAPVEAAIERLYLLIVPSQEVKYDSDKEEQIRQSSKQADLQRIETAKKKEAEQGKSKADDTFVEKLTTQIIKNVQVKIKDIHIRYEDSVTNPGKPFAFGITLSNLSIETTNDQWEAAIVNDAVSKIYKVLNLDALAVYLNCNCPTYSNMPVNDIIKYLKDGIATREMKAMNYLYMLGPINSSARLRLNPKPENDEEPFSVSKVLLNLEMEKLAIGISKHQYHDIMLLADSMSRMSRGLPYRKYRPFVKTYRGHYKLWWKFAYTCILEEEVRRRRRNWDWEHIRNHRELCKVYAQAYQSKLQNKKVPSNVQEQINHGEKILDLFNLVIIRQRIELEVARLNKKTEEQKAKTSWFSSWWGKSASNEDKELSTTADIMKQFQEAMTPEEKSKLFRAIDYQENSAPAEYPEVFVATNCAFVLRCLEIEIRDDTLKIPRVLSTELKGVNCRLQQRPASNGLKVAVKIDQFTVYGLQQKDILPQLVSSEDFSEGGVLLDVLFELNPLDKKCDQRLHIKSLPVKVIYDAETILKIGDVFKPPQSLTLDELQAATANKIADFKEMSALGLQHAVEKHVIMDLNVNFSAPYILVPHNGIYSNPKSLLIINLGNVKVYSVVRDLKSVNVHKMHREGTTEDVILKALMSHSYDKFQLELSDMQILLANANEDWRTSIAENTITSMHLLQPINLTVNVNKCLVSDDPRLPKLKITGQLPSIMLNVCDDRILNLIELLTSIPTGDNIDTQPMPLNNLQSKGSALSLHFAENQLKKKVERAQDFDDPEEFIQVTEMDIRFEMKELVVNVSSKMEEDAAGKILQFRCMSLEVDMIQQTFNMNINLRLGGIGLTHFRPMKNELQIISTPMTSGQDDYLFTVEFIQVKKNSPEFHTKYGSCVQQLLFNFTSLSLLLHQEAIQELLQLANSFQKKLEIITASTKTDKIAVAEFPSKPSRHLSIIDEISVKSKSGTNVGRTKRHTVIIPNQVVEMVLLKLVAKLAEFDMLITNDRHPIASFAIKGVETSIVMKKLYTEIQATLTDLNIFDCNPKSIHSKILCKTGEDVALNAQVVLYNNENNKRATNEADMSVIVQMSCIKITFLNLFVSSVLDFLNKFQAAQQKIIEASAAAAEQAKQNLQSAYENASKIDLNIKLKAPVIIVPTNSTSYDAIVIDLGNIELTNRFIKLEILNEFEKPAIVDDLCLELTNMKVSRVLLNHHLDKKFECTLLKPLSFILKIKRNLSTSWYNVIPDIDIAAKVKSIEFFASETDYSKIMQVLSENFSEIVEAPQTMTQKNDTDKNRRMTRTLSIDTVKDVKTVDVDEETKPHIFLRFTFTMESLVVNLFKTGYRLINEEDSFVPKEKDGLARFTLLILSIKGRILSDQSISTSILLVDCLLDDTRSDQKGKITRLMERKETNPTIDCACPSTNVLSDNVKDSMIDVTYQQKGSDLFADVRVYSFNLILSIDYLMKIAAFFSPISDSQIQADSEMASIKSQKSTSTKTKVDVKSRTSSQPKKLETSLTLNLKVEKPDIILVERMDSIETNALILNNELLLNMRISGISQTIRASLTDLQLYTCCYNPAKRNETKFPVLHPCNITLTGSTPVNKGLHMDVNLTDIRLSVSPAVIELLSRCQSTMTGADAAAAEDSENVVSYTDIWDPKSFIDSDYWFLKTDEGQEALETSTYDSIEVEERKWALKEICNISALSIVITIEAGVGNNTLPMLLLETSFEACVQDWSSKFTIESSLSMQMAYFNNRLAVWEPLIEPVEIMQDNTLVHVPWSLKIDLKKNDQEDQVTLSPNSDTDIEEVTFTQPTISINISSSVNLEIVVTKTLMEVISNLGKAFQNAVKLGIPVKEADTAPYKVVNDCGIPVTLLLEESHFQIYSSNNGAKEYKEVLLETGAEVKLDLKYEDDKLQNKVQLGKSMSTFSVHQAIDKYLIILVNDMNCKLSLPVARADKRYFPLNYRGENKDNWGLISDVTVQGAETIITLRSMLQVYNHFNLPVNIYYMTERGNELEIIKQVPPNTSVNLPMHGVYTMTNELFFSVEGHCVTALPYVWKDLQHNLSMAKTLTCPSSIKSSESFVMKVCGDIEQVYFENSSKHTMVSTCYNIHLRPAVTFNNCLPIPVICVIQGNVEESVVNPGQQLNLPTVNPGSSYIILRLSNYLEKEWCCRHDIISNAVEFSVWQFDSHDSVAKMTLDLGMHCENKNGTMILSLYCPFWMLNKTSLMLSYRKSSKVEKSASSPAKNSDETVNILHHPEDFKGPILFSFTAKNFFGKKKAAIRVNNGEWSDKFSLDVAGSSGMVVCKSDNLIHQIGVHNQLTYNGLTKQVTFTPYFVLINNTAQVIECQELERPADPWVKVESNSCKPLWPRSERDDKLLKIRIQGTFEISAPFLFTEVHTTLLKLANKFGGINVDVQVTEGGIYITFTPYGPGLAPVLILNHTNHEICIWEKESVNVKRLMKKNRLLHTWENPTGPRLLVWETGKKKEIEDDLRKDGLGEFKLYDKDSIYWVSFLDGMQRVLLFTENMNIAQDAQSAGDLESIEQEITISIHGLGISLINNNIRQELMYIGIASSGVIWEACKLSSKRYKQLSMKDCIAIESAYQANLMNESNSDGPINVDGKIEVDFQQEMMYRPNKRRIRRVFQTGLWFQMKTSPNQMQLHAKINRVQIDNQMYDCIFPVILAPVPPPKSVAADSAIKPFAELSIVQRVMKHSTVQQYKYFKVLIQEFHIKVDLGFVNALMAMFEAEETSDTEEVELFIKDMSLVDEPLMAHVSTQSLQEQKNFYDLLHFSPLKIHVSFSLAAPTHQTGGQSSSSTPAFLNVLLQGLGVTLTDMQDVVFRLAYFEREYSFLTQKQLSSEATSHYVGQFVKQLYVLVLGLDVIGNPYGLVLGISKGVEDLFYEPFQGAIQGPGEFAEGLVLGVRSLFGHTVGGAAGAVSRITGAMGKGIAALTFDKDYQRKRRDQINKRPANIQEGIARGGKGLVMGVVDGVTGVFTKPVRGAKEQGVEGFFKGLGKGAVGLVTRPTAGVIDFASGSLDAVKRATEMGDDVIRLRAPRFMRTDGLVRPYIKQEAEGNKLLAELEKGKYATTDIYAYHIWIVEGKDILLLTDKRLAYVVHNDIFGGWQMEWSYTWKEIYQSKVVDRGVQVTTVEPKKKVLGIFGSGEHGKIIIIPDKSQRQVVKEKIEALRQNANLNVSY